MNNPLEISICLGSSCFSRGNNQSLEIIQQFIEKNDIEAKIDFRGCLCQGDCKNGPLLLINGTKYDQVYPITVIDILNHELSENEK